MLPRLSNTPGWGVAVLLLLTFLAYAPVWQAGFIWDDEIMLTENPVIHAPDGLRAIWFSTRLPDYFPLTSTVLWAQWRLWGANPLGYHLVNVLLHALSAVLWWRVLRQLALPGAWLAAALFALHPVNAESVAWITELKNTLAMFFFALTLLAYLKAHETRNANAAVENRLPEFRVSKFELHWGWYITALAAFVLALLSKTAVAPLPLVLLGIAWWRRGRVQRRDVWRSLPFFAAAAALALVTIWFQYHRAIGGTVVRTDSLGSRLATAGWAVWFYLYQAVLPLNLSFIYPRWQIDSANALAYLPGLAFVGILAVCWATRRRWGKAALLGLGYFSIMLLPVLGFLNISFMRFSLVADRWQYFAIIGPVALAAAALVKFEMRTSQRDAGATEGRPAPERSSWFRVSTATGAVLLTAFGILTWRQSATFISRETLWRATLARNPHCAMAHTELANVLVQQGHTDEAFAQYRHALELDPQYELANYNYGFALLQQGDAARAIPFLERTLAAQPDAALAHYQLGNALLQLDRAAEAALHFRKALELHPEFAEIQNALGDVLLRDGQVDEAIHCFERALATQPGYPNALCNLGVALFQKGRKTEALTRFHQALDLQPDFVEAQVNLGKALLQLGRAAEAIVEYRAALKSHPDDVATLSELAWILATWPEDTIRNGPEALALAQRANRVSGGRNPEALRTLAAACAENARFAEAAGAARTAWQLAEAQTNAVLAEALQTELKRYEAGLDLKSR